MKFGELKAGDWFLPDDEDEVYLKVFNTNYLQTLLTEGSGGHAVLVKTGEVCFFHDHEFVNQLEVETKITDCF